jgi:hypothetical protein
MSKTKLISAIAILLLIINIALIGFHFFRKPPHHGGPRNEIIERLEFDNNQIEKYDELIKNHQATIRNLDSEIADKKSLLYALLLKENNVTLKDSLIYIIAEKQTAIEQTHFAHFEEIHKLCKPAQEEKFKELTKEMSELFPRGRMKH